MGLTNNIDTVVYHTSIDRYYTVVDASFRDSLSFNIRHSAEDPQLYIVEQDSVIGQSLQGGKIQEHNLTYSLPMGKEAAVNHVTKQIAHTMNSVEAGGVPWTLTDHRDHMEMSDAMPTVAPTRRANGTRQRMQNLGLTVYEGKVRRQLVPA